MQPSTVISDGLLALACLAGAGWLLRNQQFTAAQQATRLAAVCGLLLTALAAAVGSLRFAGMDELIELHRSLSNASGAIGLPLLVFAALALSRRWQWNTKLWLALAAVLGAGMFLADWSEQRATYGLLITLLSLCLLLLAGLAQWPRKAPINLSVGVTGLFLLAGIVVGSQGSIGPLLRVDLFHALLMPAYLLLARLMIVLAKTESPCNKPHA